MVVSHVVAMAENRVIGKEGRMPWHIPGEQKIFRELTTGKALVLGRKTHESIGEAETAELVKGLRAMSDFEQEVQMAMVNTKLNPNLDTVFFPATEKYTYLSSSVAKELARYHANLDEFLPREIIDDVKNKLDIRSDECNGRQH